MKKIFIAVLAISFTIIACEKKSGYVDPSLPATGAKVKFINTSWNSPGVIFYGTDTIMKFSAGTTATGGLLTGTTFNQTYPSNDYAVLPAYDNKLRIRVAQNATVTPGVFMELNNVKFEEGKNYSVFLVDSFPTVTTLVLNDDLKNFNTLTDSTYSARFVNTIFGSPAVDIFSVRENAVLASNIPYKGFTEFKTLKVWSSADEMQVRLAGTTTVLAKIAFTPTIQRTYTLFARGRYGNTTTAIPALSFYTNQ